MPISFFRSLVEKFTGRPVDWDELEETLIRADLGVPITMRIIEELQERGSEIRADDIVEVTREVILRILPRTLPPIRPLPAKPKIIFVVGVNGTGKTTSTAKLAHWFKSHRHSVMLAAADTFRAAAIEQLDIWAQRIDVPLIKGQYNGDPAALCYDAYIAAEKRNIEFLICDTAGRLHTKSNLMLELEKMKRSVAKHDAKAPHEVFLVVDATTGSNALAQAKEFHQATNVTGLIVTKLDGSGKGGVLVAIQDALQIPTRFIGTGEKVGDFAEFNPDTFVERVL